MPTVSPPTPFGNQTTHRMPTSALPVAVKPTSMAKLGWVEDKGNPPVALLNLAKQSAFKRSSLHIGNHILHLHHPIVVSCLTASPPLITWLGHKEDEGNPTVALFQSEESAGMLPLLGGKL